jgi:excisionase family DNA binding protein
MIVIGKEKLITLEEAAEICGVTELTVRQWAKRLDRPLETVKLGGTRRTSHEALQRYSEQSDATTATAVGAVIGSPHGSDYAEAMQGLRTRHGLKD